jgi:hypothetical protein
VTQIPVLGGWQHIYYNRWVSLLHHDDTEGTEVPTLQGTTQTLTTTLQWQRLPKPHQSITPWKLSVEALGTQAQLGVGQQPTQRLRECNRDPPLKNS